MIWQIQKRSNDREWTNLQIFCNAFWTIQNNIFGENDGKFFQITNLKFSFDLILFSSF